MDKPQQTSHYSPSLRFALIASDLISHQLPASLLPPAFVNWLVFIDSFHQLSNSKSTESKSLYAFICNRLYQFKLDRFLVQEVLNEVFLRAHRAVMLKGQLIKNPLAWCRSVAYHVIFEQAREKGRFIPFDEAQDLPDGSQDWAIEVERAYELMLFKRAFHLLPLEDQWLLDRFYLQEQSWAEVREEYRLCKGEDVSTPTLRQRAHRARTRLHQLYVEIQIRDSLDLPSA